MTKKETKSIVLLQHHLKSLKLPTRFSECEKIAGRCATDNVDHLGYLLQLCELELIERERRAAERRLKAARFPTHKTLETFDFKLQPSINKVLVTQLMRGGVHRQAGEHSAGRQFRDGKDASDNRFGNRRLWSGQTGPLLPSDRADHAPDGSPRGSGTVTSQETSCETRSADSRRVGLCAGQQARLRTVVRCDQHRLRATQCDRNDQSSLRELDRSARQ